MTLRSDLEADLGLLTSDTKQFVEQHARLKRINAQMLSALQSVLPVLQEGLPGTVDFDTIQKAIARVQDAIAEAERDP